jgi:hypothetical protein
MVLGMAIVVATPLEEKQVLAAKKAFDTAAPFTDQDGMKVTFDVRVRVQAPNKQAVPEPGTVHYPTNRYLAEGRPGFTPQAVGDPRAAPGDTYIGGVTRGGGAIRMNSHRYYGGLGNSPDLVKHEIGHLFGLDDERAGPTGRYYVKGGVMDPKKVSDEHGHGDPTGKDLFPIRAEEVSMIAKFIHDYRPETHDRSSPGFVDLTPHVTFVNSFGATTSHSSLSEAKAAFAADKRTAEDLLRGQQEAADYMRQLVETHFNSSKQPAPQP